MDRLRTTGHFFETLGFDDSLLSAPRSMRSGNPGCRIQRHGGFWNYTERELEKAGNWPGRRGKLVAALLTTRRLDLVPGPDGGQHHATHDWTEHQAHLARIRDAARAAANAKWA